LPAKRNLKRLSPKWESLFNLIFGIVNLKYIVDYSVPRKEIVKYSSIHYFFE
jgi:hypothetical protein